MKNSKCFALGFKWEKNRRENPDRSSSSYASGLSSTGCELPLLITRLINPIYSRFVSRSHRWRITKAHLKLSTAFRFPHTASVGNRGRRTCGRLSWVIFIISFPGSLNLIWEISFEAFACRLPSKEIARVFSGVARLLASSSSSASCRNNPQKNQIESESIALVLWLSFPSQKHRHLVLPEKGLSFCIKQQIRFKIKPLFYLLRGFAFKSIFTRFLWTFCTSSRRSFRFEALARS